MVNHKRVLRVMREESLLCQLKRRWVTTTDLEHGPAIFPNLLRQVSVARLNLCSPPLGKLCYHPSRRVRDFPRLGTDE